MLYTKCPDCATNPSCTTCPDGYVPVEPYCFVARQGGLSPAYYSSSEEDADGVLFDIFDAGYAKEEQ